MSKKFDLAGFGRKIARFTVDQCSEMRKELRANNRTGVLSDDDYDAADDLLLDRRDAARADEDKRAQREKDAKPESARPIEATWYDKRAKKDVTNPLIEISGGPLGWKSQSKGPSFFATVLQCIDEVCASMAAFDYEVDIDAMVAKLQAVDMAKAPSVAEVDWTKKK